MNKEEETRKIIEGVLSRKEFQKPVFADLSWLESVRKFFNDLISKIFDFFMGILEKLFSNIRINPNFLRGKASGAVTIVKIVIVCFIVVLVVLLIIVGVKIFLRIRSNKKLQEEDDDEIASFVENTDVPLTLAQKYENEGNFRFAFRYLYIALLINLNTREIIHIEKAKTNRQYIREIRENKPEIIDNFVPFTEAFAFYWYGKRTIDKEQLSAWNIVYYSLCEGGVNYGHEKK